jgi:hypothetical protein
LISPSKDNGVGPNQMFTLPELDGGQLVNGIFENNSFLMILEEKNPWITLWISCKYPMRTLGFKLQIAKT